MDVQAEPTAGGPGGASSGDKMDDGTKKEEEEQENDGDVCALFAMSTPRDIWANPSLAALAALIDEDEDQKEESIEAEQGKQPSGRAAAPQSDSPGTSKAAAPNDRAGPGTTSDNEGAAQFFQDADNITTVADNHKNSTGSSSSGGASGARHQRREDTKRRRNERRATPYGAADAAGAAARRGRGGVSSSAGARGRRAGPTAGEAQVMMSLWGL